MRGVTALAAPPVPSHRAPDPMGCGWGQPAGVAVLCPGGPPAGCPRSHGGVILAGFSQPFSPSRLRQESRPLRAVVVSQGEPDLQPAAQGGALIPPATPVCFLLPTMCVCLRGGDGGGGRPEMLIVLVLGASCRLMSAVAVRACAHRHVHHATHAGPGLVAATLASCAQVGWSTFAGGARASECV